MGIDVIVPVYKPDKKFERLFAGLLSQTVKPDRIILMVTQAEDAGCADIKRRLDKLMRRQKICGRKRIEVSLVPVNQIRRKLLSLQRLRFRKLLRQRCLT